ncbi:tetratricopeptide repeat protein [Streptomyces sp. NBC_00249]|uniref:ATP-binding protein n=1 Tax=Streptomyces sp. NBC_00249 TaxID=2975690 RepID=UPI00224E0F44|nr:tetratricopeptide repeat protein [Streptomyces sp. NBC_00249]MCX5199127.1 tetratricopeptide repeat protein [Streptomyces sp. NBC_00249]
MSAAEQWARADGHAHITQVAGDYVTTGPAPRALLGLPEGPAVLVGRDGPVKELAGLLADGGPAVAVVAGLAGVGKSALAVATAHRAVELGWFGDRVFFLPLRGYAPDGGLSGAQAVQEMLRLLGIRDTDMPGSPEARVALYRARLAGFARAGQRVLVVADDAGSVAQVRDLVPAGGAHRLLITSRHRLVAPGFAARVVALEELGAGAAVELLAAALPGDLRPAREPAALAEVARRCGRLPLALTVAGALLAGDPGLSVGELAGQLAAGLEALTFEGGGAGEVPVGVRAAFDLSYARLPADQARLFRLLTVNPGPDCSTVYAGLLAGEADVRPKLAALARASLVVEQPVGSGRWRMHDLVRMYAVERGEECAEGDGREAAVDSLLEGLCSEVAEAVRALGVRGPAVDSQGAQALPLDKALHWLDTERPLLIAAMGLSADSGRIGTAIRLADDLGPYLQLYGHTDEGIQLTRHLLSAVREAGSRGVLGATMTNLAGSLLNARQLPEAIELLMEALTLFDGTPHKEAGARALNLLGGAYRMTRRFEEARKAHEQALAVFRELGMRHGEGTVLVRLAEVYQEMGLTDEAIDAYRQAVAHMQEAGDRQREAVWLGFLGNALGRAGRREESLAVQEQALALLSMLGHRIRAAWTIYGIAAALLKSGRLDEAYARYAEALVLFEEAGDRNGEASARTGMGLIYLRLGRAADALEAGELACSFLAGTAYRSEEGAALRLRGLALASLGRNEEAAEAFERVAVMLGEDGHTEQQEAALLARDAVLRQEPAPPRRWWQRFTRG